MPYTDLRIPPGLKANGTERQSKGFWREADHCRDYGSAIGPIGGSRSKTVSGASITGSARAMLCWRDSAQARWTAIGTHTKAFAMSASGVVTEITPAGFTSGRADATTTGGFGRGAFGRGAFGTPRPDTGSIAPATQWDFALWGVARNLLGCSEDDGDIYTWDRDVGNDFTAVANAPTSVIAIVVDENNILVAIFENSVQWSDQGDNEEWTASATTQAGDKDAQTSGTFRCGRAVRGATLVFSDVDLWSLTYRGGVFVYDFLKVADGCGTVSKGSPIVLDSRCFWMGEGAFWEFNGGQVSAIPCPVQEEVFGDINYQQISKVWSAHNAKNNEIWWFYPSDSATEIDKAVSYNYLTGTWWTHSLARTCGHGAAGIFQQPLMLTTANVVKEHEVGIVWDVTPYVRTAPLELGAGDPVILCGRAVGDEKTQGEASLKFYLKDQANADWSETSTYALTTTPTDVRFAARQVEMAVLFSADGRFGDAKLDIQAGGRR